MRTYFEMFEELTEEEMLTEQPQMIRLEISDEREAEKLLKEYEVHFRDRKYQARVHFCRHEDEEPCNVKILKRAERTVSEKA